MVACQIKARGILDPKLLDAMQTVRRDIFVPDSDRIHSYMDGPLPIGHGQTISQPYIVAYMTDLLNLSGTEKVLEIGTGCGYQTAVLAELAGSVYTVEVIGELSIRARKRLVDRLKYDNIYFKTGNGREGWNECAPFDRILITAAPPLFPEALFSQLTDGGIAVAPVGDYFQRIYRYVKRGGKVKTEELIAVSFVPMV